MASVTRFGHFWSKNWVLDTVFRSQYPRAPGEGQKSPGKLKVTEKSQKRQGKAKSRRRKPKVTEEDQKRRESPKLRGKAKSRRRRKGAASGAFAFASD